MIDQCSTLNFARRDQCFGCGAAAGGGFSSSIPTNVLRVSKLRRNVTVEQVCATYLLVSVEQVCAIYLLSSRLSCWWDSFPLRFGVVTVGVTNRCGQRFGVPNVGGVGATNLRQGNSGEENCSTLRNIFTTLDTALPNPIVALLLFPLDMTGVVVSLGVHPTQSGRTYGLTPRARDAPRPHRHSAQNCCTHPRCNNR